MINRRHAAVKDVAEKVKNNNYERLETSFEI